MKEGGGEAHGQIHGCHLILVHQGHYVMQEAQERLQGLPVLICQQQDGGLHGLQPLFSGDIWREVSTRLLEEESVGKNAGAPLPDRRCSQASRELEL